MLLQESALSFTVVRIAVAAYLTYLGLSALISILRRKYESIEFPRNRLAVLGKIKSPFAQGALNNILNPKMAIQFISLIPQFITSGKGHFFGSLSLALIFGSMGLVWLLFFSTVVATGKNYLGSQRARRAFDAASCTVLIGLGPSIGLRV